MNRPFTLGIILLLVLVPRGDARASIPSFFGQLFSEIEAEYAPTRISEFDRFRASHDLDSLDTGNLRTFLLIHFFHDLFTCTGASDCARGGLLEIPYFWHWVDPNPRHSIFLLPDSTLLKNLSLPRSYSRYKSYADIDRVPELYLSDLVAEAPRYAHTECGSFFTFGWCSEREMSFLALMISFGFQGKIRQSGIHTYTALWCEFQRSDGEKAVFSAEVDNTFDSISWRPVPAATTLDHWLREIGSGTQIAWYNRMARSREQLEALRSAPVSAVTRARILEQVRRALSAGKH